MREALPQSRTATSPTASSTSASHSADSAPSSGSARRCTVSSMTVPSVSRCSPLSEAVRRRSSRAGVLSRRCAVLSRQHAAATRMPAGRIVERVDEVAGERGEPAPGEREPRVVVKAPAGELEVVGRARARLPRAPAGSAAARRSRSRAPPIATAPSSPSDASAISVRRAELGPAAGGRSARRARAR